MRVKHLRTARRSDFNFFSSIHLPVRVSFFFSVWWVFLCFIPFCVCYCPSAQPSASRLNVQIGHLPHMQRIPLLRLVAPSSSCSYRLIPPCFVVGAITI